MRIKKTSQYMEGGASLSNVYGTSNEDGYTQEYVNNMIKVLWTNPDMTQSFTSQEVTLTDDISNYRYYEIIFQQTNVNINTCSSGKIPISKSANMTLAVRYNVKRAFNPTTKIFTSCYIWNNYGGTESEDNSYVIPYQIIGYK